MGKGSKAPSGPQEVVQTTSNLPEYARPYFEEMLGRTVAETTRPYELFPGQRLAELTEFEQLGQQGMLDLAAAGTPLQTMAASDIASQVGFQPVGTGLDIAGQFQPQQLQSQYQAGAIDPNYAAGTLGQGFQAGQRGVGYQAGQFDPGYVARELGQDYTARDLQSQYQGQLDTGPGFQAGTVADAATLESYMNPYQQLVTDIEKREAQRASDTQAAEISQQAALAGGLGGYREAILQSERERNLAQQLGDIQARGGQAAFDQAQKAFEADRAARLQEAQFGLQTGTEQQKALQQAEQFRQAAFGATEQARQAQQGMAIDAFQAGEAAKQQAAQLGLTAQQQEDAAQRAQEDFAQQQFQQNEQLRLAQQQEDRAAFQAGEAARQEAARLGLSAQEIEDRALQAENQARLDTQKFNIQAQETAARLGLAGLGADQATRSQQLEAARVLGTLGGQEQALALERLQNLQAAGQIQRELTQRGLDIGYGDFLRQQAFPREQLSFFSNLLRGLPIAPGQTQAVYGAEPSAYQQALGAGIGGVGLYKALAGGI
tara:strand:- start:1597 stop:3234 length:1638 start_codon:yes stop_codon:yes gene_type:complete